MVQRSRGGVNRSFEEDLLALILQKDEATFLLMAPALVQSTAMEMQNWWPGGFLDKSSHR